jgi:hypothetical protein
VDEITLQGSIDGAEGSIDALRIGDQEPIRHLEATSIRRSANAVSFAPRIQGETARLPNGDAIERITLQSPGATNARVTIAVNEDFESFRAALSATVKERPAAWPPLALRQTLAKLSAHGSSACCEVVASVPVGVEPAVAPQETRALTAPFESQCGACHHTADASPPNFLSGDAARVRRALASCAPRIYVRLAMNELPASQRDKTPMPPEFPTAAPKERAPRPLRSDLLALRHDVERMLHQQYDRVPKVSELLANGYEALPPCLPAGTDQPRPSLHTGRATP